MGFYVHYGIIVTGWQEEIESAREKIISIQAKSDREDNFDLVSEIKEGWNSYCSFAIFPTSRKDIDETGFEFRKQIIALLEREYCNLSYVEVRFGGDLETSDSLPTIESSSILSCNND